MSGFLYRGRHYNGNREATLKSKSHTKDFSSDETEKGPPLQTHSLREFEQHLNDLKKENFSLKLRIYFLEERIQQKFEDYSSEDVHKKNIELKVAVESLKQELQEKQQQFDKALATAEGVSDHNEAEVRHCCEERQQEISHIQEVLETKIKLLQEEANLARSEAEKMAILAASESQRCVDLERRMSAEAEVTEKNCSRQTQQEILAEKERLIKKLGESLCSREKEVVSLNKEKSFLTRKVAQLEKEVSIQHMEKDTKTEPDIGRSLKQLEMQKVAVLVNKKPVETKQDVLTMLKMSDLYFIVGPSHSSVSVLNVPALMNSLEIFVTSVDFDYLLYSCVCASFPRFALWKVSMYYSLLDPVINYYTNTL